MALGDLTPFSIWVSLYDPPYIDARPVEAWIRQLHENYAAAPSIPYDTSAQPVSEVRMAVLKGRRQVEVWYEYRHVTGVVDLLLVRWKPVIT